MSANNLIAGGRILASQAKNQMEKIGKMQKILTELLDFYSDDHDDLRGIPATDAEISEAEKILNVKFSNEYIQFIKIFGGAYAGYEIHAFQNAPILSKNTVTELTIEFRTAYLSKSKCSIINQSYVISMDGSGNPIMLDPQGKVLIYYHDAACDATELNVLSDSFFSLLESEVPNMIDAFSF